MPLISGTLTQDGAIVDILVGVGEARRQRLLNAGFPIPAVVPLRAQIDTGSHVTCLMPEAFDRLEIQAFRAARIRTPSTKRGTPHHCQQFVVSISLVSGLSTFPIPDVHAIASEDFSPGETVEAIIGRDILDLCVFCYHGPHGTFELAF
jgi:hypothetical protein